MAAASANGMRPSLVSGGRVIAIEPRRSESAELADLQCSIEPGSDATIASGPLVQVEAA